MGQLGTNFGAVRVTIDELSVAEFLDRTVPPRVGKAAGIAAARARDNCQRIRTGRMKRSIRDYRVRAGSWKYQWAIGSDVYYTIYQERGTRTITPAHFLLDAVNSITVADFL